ncbi:MAG: thiamine-phosphate kinase [Nocardioidaceae bacterium]
MADKLPETLGELGEFGLIEALTARFAQGEQVLLGPGDDAAVVRLASRELVTSLDMLIQNQHFRLDWSSAVDIGRKAAAVNLSDINAMGGTASALVVGLGAPAELDTQWALDFAGGLAEEVAKVGASVVGGDLSRARDISIAVAVVGDCEHGVVRRAGARPGDIVAHVGRQGWAEAGYAVLARGFRSPRVVVEAHRRADPPYAAGPQAAVLGATAMIDVSDGLLQDIGHLAAASGVTIDVETARFDLPEPLQAVGAALGVDPMRFVLTGGDDYGLVATFPDGTELPESWRAIGRVVEADRRGGVLVDGAAYGEPAGHQHFR